MKKVFVIFLLSIAYVSSFSQTLSKQETVDYIKTKLTKSAEHFKKCYDDGSVLIEKILDVKCADNKLFVTINHTYVDGAGYNQKEPMDFVIVLGKDFVATPTSYCGDRVFEIGGFKLVISKDDAESLVKALNYLNKICVDPFK